MMRENNTRMNVKDIGFEKGSHMKLGKDRVQWRAF
jgi:hypothetical protein